MKKGVLSLFGLLAITSSIASVSAETIATEWGRTAAGGIVSFLESMKLNPTALSTILLGVLLWVILYSIVIKFGFFDENKKLSWIGPLLISLAITILSFIYLPENFVEAIVLQYGALGATILTVIPFLILLYFSISVSSSLLIARAIWIFYIVYYFALFSYKLATLPAGSPISEYIPYLGAIIAGILILIFLGAIRKKFWTEELAAKEEKAIRDIKFRELGRKLEKEETESRIPK